MNWEFHPEAEAEYQDAIRYYLRRNPAAARRFVVAIEHAISRVCESPYAWPRTTDRMRRCLARPFPYGVVYFVGEATIMVVAVSHTSRRPDYWSGRVIDG